MAQRRSFHTIARQATALLSANPTSLHLTLEALPSLTNPISVKTLIASKSSLIFTEADVNCWSYWSHRHPRHFSSNDLDDNDNERKDADDEEKEEEDGEEMCGEGSDEEDTASDLERDYSVEEKEAEAAVIGYKVVGPLQPSDQVFKSYEPVFAVVQIGSHQFKVCNRDSIFTERLKFCEVNDKLILNKVLLLGSRTQTIVGRPTVPDAAVHAVVEEHALDAKVIIFKKKRRKNYRRTKGHRQELTKLRITDIQGIEKTADPKPKKLLVKKQEKVPVEAAVKKQEKVADAA